MKAIANGLATNYEVHGRGEPVTLVHALGLNLGSWWLQVPALAVDHQVLAYDVRGHGESEKPAGPYTIDLFAEDLLGLLDALAIQRTTLIGLSMGGMIAQTLAVAHPERVRALVLCDTASGYNQSEREVFVQRADTVRREGMEPIVDPTLERWFTQPYRESSPEIMERIAGWLRANNPAAYAASCEAVGGMAMTDRLTRIGCPTLMVVGAEDKSTTPAMAARIAQGIAGARLEVVSRAAHLLPVEQAEVFNALVRGFLPTV